MKPYYQSDNVTLYHGDFREIAPRITCDCVIADPPYGQTSLAWDCWQYGWLDLTPSNALWCFGTLRMFLTHAEEFRAWGKFSQDLVWEKHNGSGFHADRFRRVHEQVALFYKGEWRDVYHDPQVTLDAVAKVVRRRKNRPPHMGHIENAPYESVDGGPKLTRSVLRIRSEHGRAQHPTQKPVALIKPLVQYSCKPGGMVFSPFAGVGSELVAAVECGRKAIGAEINEKYCEIAARRLEVISPTPPHICHSCHRPILGLYRERVVKGEVVCGSVTRAWVRVVVQRKVAC